MSSNTNTNTKIDIYSNKQIQKSVPLSCQPLLLYKLGVLWQLIGRCNHGSIVAVLLGRLGCEAPGRSLLHFCKPSTGFSSLRFVALIFRFFLLSTAQRIRMWLGRIRKSRRSSFFCYSPQDMVITCCQIICSGDLPPLFSLGDDCNSSKHPCLHSWCPDKWLCLANSEDKAGSVVQHRVPNQLLKKRYPQNHLASQTSGGFVPF